MPKLRHTGLGQLIIILAALLALAPLSAFAGRGDAQPPAQGQDIVVAGECTFDVGARGRMQTWTLQDNCVTTESIVVPHATTLDGDGNTITAVDPEGGHFLGAVITNEPVSGEQPQVMINVTNVQIYAGNLANACDEGDERLRGIWLNGASGSVTNVTIKALNQGASGCQEGNAIEAVNYDESGPRARVTIANNTVLNWQKSGIVVNVNVDARVTGNYVGVSATEENLAPNSIQIGYGASANVMHNNVHGSQWLGESNYASAGFLLYEAGSVEVNANTLNYNPFVGNAEVGIYILYTDNSRIIRNVLFDNGSDTGHADIGGAVYDWGIYDCGVGNLVAANQITGFNIPIERCYSGSRGNATSMSTLSREAAPSVADTPGAPDPFI